jgi:hypothetical protein
MHVSDGSIVFYHEPDPSRCAQCYCLIPGSWVTYKSGPLKAGTYKLYEQMGFYCPREPCPLRPVPAPVLIGEITVKGRTGIHVKYTSKTTGLSTFPNPFTKSLNIKITSDKNRPAGVILVNSEGKAVRQFRTVTNKTLQADIRNLAAGIYVLKAVAGKERYVKKLLLQR